MTFDDIERDIIEGMVSDASPGAQPRFVSICSRYFNGPCSAMARLGFIGSTRVPVRQLVRELQACLDEAGLVNAADHPAMRDCLTWAS